MSSTTNSYEYCGYDIRIECQLRPEDHKWTATYWITRVSDGALATYGAIAGGYLSAEEAATGAKKAADYWVDKQAQP